MRLSFPNIERESILVAPGDTTIGSAPDNIIVIKNQWIATHHAKLTVDARGYTLSVLDPQARVYVNARPVREKAILRLGDIISLDTVQLLLKPDSDDCVKTTLPLHKPAARTVTAEQGAPISVVLRGVSGSYFGKIVAVKESLTIGRGNECELVLDEPDMPAHLAVIERIGSYIYLRSSGSTYDMFVNGVKVRNAVLYSGDQLAFGHHRFLLEAPGLPRSEENEKEEAEEVTPVNIQPISQPTRDDENNLKNHSVWWLIGTAVIVGLIISGLLLMGQF